ncbi:MAG: class I SAM-dependent methyltransferase [bacterium]|nr:class I SAM-dependent methyltransferase [bacterium]
MHIHSAWKQYFTHRHEGLGSTYERFLLHHIFEEIAGRHAIYNVLEVPSFGMTGVSGINSLWWAARKVPVTLLDNDRERMECIRGVWQELSFETDILYHPIETGATLPFNDRIFDMAWNFAALWFVPDLKQFLAELTRVSRKAILLCIPNRLNIFHMIRMRSPEMANSVYVGNIHPGKITTIMKKLNWTLEKQAYFDIPPWPDIAMNKEKMLQKIGLKRLGRSLEQEKDQEPLCILDYFNGRNIEMEQDVLKYAFLENSPRLFAKFWAHHQYLLFTPSYSKQIDKTKNLINRNDVAKD